MSKNRIIKRLARELKELNREPLLGTNAAPVSDDNLLEWHCTTLGPPGTPYENTPFHWVLEFPDNYPLYVLWFRKMNLNLFLKQKFLSCL